MRVAEQPSRILFLSQLGCIKINPKPPSRLASIIKCNGSEGSYGDNTEMSDTNFFSLSNASVCSGSQVNFVFLFDRVRSRLDLAKISGH